jgi:hypothetical protein
MRRVFGPRTAVEAAFLVAVPILVGVVFGAGMWTIVAASGVAYLVIVLVEAFLWYEGKRAPDAPARTFLRPRSVVVRRPDEEPPGASGEPEVEPAFVLEPVQAAPAAAEPEPAPAAEPVAAPVTAPVTASVTTPLTTPAPAEHVHVLPRQPEADPEPEPEPVERVPLVAVPALEPEPPMPGPTPVQPVQPVQPAAASTVVPIGVGSGPRQWNLWDLERLTRDAAGEDAARDEERTFLLMYLREFAGADGLLPVDFDGLVRDSFGDLVGSR